MFNLIELRELPTWVDVLRQQGKTPEEMLADLTLIDDLLVLQKTQSLLLRKKSLKTQIDARIGVELGYQAINLNGV
jgi:hypothetical protein